MKLRFDEEVNVLYIELSENAVERTVEIQQGILADFDNANQLTGIEILNEDSLRKTLRENGGDIRIPDSLPVV